MTFAKTSVPDTATPVPIELFVRGEPYRFLGFSTTWHLFGVNPGPDNNRFYFPFGTDQLGRDLLSRTLVGGQVSLTVGVVGIIISFAIGIVMGGLSGYYGGAPTT